jgi:hypothetical protein
MRRLHQLIACYLTLCLALAGAIGINPLLHQLIEHGGTGPVHTHAGGFDQLEGASTHVHPHNLLHRHNDEPLFTPVHGNKRLFAHEHEFALPRIPLKQIFHFLADLIKRGTESPDSSESTPSHHHSSLPQLIVSGLIDQHLELTLVQPIAYFLTTYSSRDTNFLLVKAWDAQMASRAPPFAQGLLV